MQSGLTASADGTSGGYLRKVSFLVAEDNEFARGIVREVLKALGATRIHYVGDGREGLQICHDFNIDIALVDWKMPVLSGLDFLKAIRTASNSPDPYLPVIMMTAHSEYNYVLRARDAGVTEYLIKPYSAKQILSRLRAVIENPRDFVKTSTYFGPDRRRRNDPNYKGQERRKTTGRKVDASGGATDNAADGAEETAAAADES